jgi:hypothetical protein
MHEKGLYSPHRGAKAINLRAYMTSSSLMVVEITTEKLSLAVIVNQSNVSRYSRLVSATVGQDNATLDLRSIWPSLM